MPASAIFVRYSSMTEPSSSPSSLADRLELLAQEVLALLLLGAALDVVADAAAHLQLRQPLALELEGEREALGDVERLEDADLLIDGQVGAVAGRVGQRAGLDDGAQERRDALVGAALLEDLLDDRAVLALELARAPVDGLVVGVLLDLGAQAFDARLGRADDRAAVQALERDAPAAAGQADGVGRPRATVPTFAYSPLCRGTSSTRSSLEMSSGRLMSIVGKTTVSSSGTSRSFRHGVVVSLIVARATIPNFAYKLLGTYDCGAPPLFAAQARRVMGLRLRRASRSA